MRTKTTIEKNKKATSLKMKSILFIFLAILGIIAESKAQNIPSYIPTNGLVGWWPFNGNANDESGNGNNGMVNGANLTSDRFGISNSAYYFDGVNNWIQIADNDDLDLPNNLSINCWFYASSFDIVSMIVSKHSPQCNNNEGTFVYGIWDEGLSGNYKINFSASPNFTSSTYSNNQGLVSLNSWHQFAITFDDNLNEFKYYLNGILIDTKNLSYEILNNPFDIFIGKQDCGNQWHFHGNIDDIAIWNRALTPQEITALYTASPTNNNETSTDNVPGAISYQAVARDAQGAPLANTNLQVRFTLIADSLSGTAEYVETHTLSTNSLGLFTTAFGAGTSVSNTFGNINWSAGNKFLKVQIDTGNGWIDMGTQQLLSTPYSMHSATSGAIKNPGLPVFDDNAAALAGGLVAGDMYRTASGDLKIVY
jgi:hypothetical protein